MTSGPEKITDARKLLEARGAAKVAHPGGTLLAHLERVQAVLQSWGAPSAVRLAGLCHAAYGTDGFATALFELSERAALAGVIGKEAEALVYFYGSCDRRGTYPRLGGPPPIAFVDRFTRKTGFPATTRLRAFAEITAANELDVVKHNSALAAQFGPALFRLFTDVRGLLSPAAWSACVKTLGRFADARG
jgi:hypothetical protein